MNSGCPQSETWNTKGLSALEIWRIHSKVWNSLCCSMGTEGWRVCTKRRSLRWNPGDNVHGEVRTSAPPKKQKWAFLHLTFIIQVTSLPRANHLLSINSLSHTKNYANAIYSGHCLPKLKQLLQFPFEKCIRTKSTSSGVQGSYEESNTQ